MAKMDRYLIPSVFQAIQLCDLLAQNAEGLAAAEIESALSLPRTSVFRLLRTLVSERLVEKRGKRYYYGNRIYEISASNAQSQQIQQALIPALAPLIAKTNKSAILSIPGGSAVFVIDVLDGSPNRVSSIRPGAKLPLFDSAPGHIMLAYQNQFSLPFYTSKLGHFDKALAEKISLSTCTRGYAAVYDNVLGTTCVSVPVFINHGELTAMLAIEIPGKEGSTKALQFWSESLKEVATLAFNHQLTSNSGLT